jgi:endonuclease YncB( thermonuclease family)
MGNCLKKKEIKVERGVLDLNKIDPNDVPSFPWLEKYIECYVYDVHDGDTLKVLLNYENSLFNISIRIFGIDTPEISRCSDLEKKAGCLVRDYVEHFLKNKFIKVYSTGWDKYGGRIDGIVMLNNINFGDHLLNIGYAKPYSGKKTKEPWGTSELNTILFRCK